MTIELAFTNAIPVVLGALIAATSVYLVARYNAQSTQRKERLAFYRGKLEDLYDNLTKMEQDARASLDSIQNDYKSQFNISLKTLSPDLDAIGRVTISASQISRDMLVSFWSIKRTTSFYFPELEGNIGKLDAAQAAYCAAYEVFQNNMSLLSNSDRTDIDADKNDLLECSNKLYGACIGIKKNLVKVSKQYLP